MELRGLSGLNGNYIVFLVTTHDKYELSLTGTSRGKLCTLFNYTYLAMGILIRIRNVCFSYRKSGVVSFFQNIEWKKVELYDFFGNYLWSYVVFRELFLINGDTRLFPETVEKMEF